ncbi:nuclear transport factor 2 family protein [Gluconobacter roseus]|uniref:nuclear transport factor 2 family protein n=1 Tax=Gluconobacter roseus TaxID=586239 RepID=UPI0038D19404
MSGHIEVPGRASEKIIRDMFAMFTDFGSDLDALTAFMTPDYRQLVDGREMSLADFRAHALALREGLSSLEIEILHLVCEADRAATVHLASATRPSGARSVIRVVAFYQFRDGRLCLVDELTHVQKGHDGDDALGSLQ